MATKREADAFIKADPDAKRVKREGGAANLSLASIPMAPSSSTTPKSEFSDRKPLDAIPNHGEPSIAPYKKRRFVGNSITARRGDDWVSAHFDSRGMTREIFQRLKEGKFGIEPAEDWGFIDRRMGLTPDYWRSDAFAPEKVKTWFSVKVRYLSQERLDAKLDAKGDVRPGQYASICVEPKIEALGVKKELEEEKLSVPSN
ncbi:hypothetical protein VPNG_03844 [Cytospora leucostoma]|uniref:Uncharacterized protein n=1 Tax=Cytospora leucostoma TaxID=1230097 RepID=A0A423XF96_9PEZI|nr:hypothetical protein VPNG_03844 [Cytospora leucostoma]